MKYLRFATSSLLVSSLTLMSVGSALADTVNYDTTGPGSTNNVTISNTSNTSVTNMNDVTITNTANQTATSGNATSGGGYGENRSGGGNTISGSVSSGNASNSDSSTISVSVGNEPASGSGGFGSSTGGSGIGAGGSSMLGGTGAVLGASTKSVGGFGGGLGGGALLPVTGPSSLVDVSALRSLYHPATIIPPAIATQSKNTSAMFLIAAAVLSLLGAFGSAIYANRREQLL